ncbi:hypothetical protein glysoja_012714 [Glycine soja]|nr:hypothetical protein glysoja_012714 [Glycine soja]
MFLFRKPNVHKLIILKPWQNPRRFQSTKKRPSESASIVDADNMCRNSPSFLHGLLDTTIARWPHTSRRGVAPRMLTCVIASSPCILVGGVDLDFVRVVEKLKGVVGKDGENLLNVLDDQGCCNWRIVLHVFEEQLGNFIVRHPSVVFEESGGSVLSLINFLFKFGLSVDRVALVLLEFPEIRVAKFLSNLRQCFLFLTMIEMEASEIGRILQSHCLVLGSFTFKKTNTLLTNLNVGKKQLYRVVRDDPLVMESRALGRRIQPFRNSYLEYELKDQKKKFMLKLGYVENSRKMNEAIRSMRMSVR